MIISKGDVAPGREHSISAIKVYKQRHVTDGELQLLQYHERRCERFKKKEQDKLAEKAYLMESVKFVTNSAGVDSIKPILGPSVIASVSLATNQSAASIRTVSLLPSSASSQLLVGPYVPTMGPMSSSGPLGYMTQVLPVSKVAPNISQARTESSSSAVAVAAAHVGTSFERVDTKEALADTALKSSPTIAMETAVLTEQVTTATRTITKKRTSYEEEDDEDIAIETSKTKPATHIKDLFDIPSLQCLFNSEWNSLGRSESLTLLLNNFGFDGGCNNVLVIKLFIPMESSQWAINICPAEHMEFQNIFLHFNPRFAGKRKTIISNDKQGTWGGSIAGSVEGLAEALGTEINLILLVRPEGFFIFKDHELVSAVPHRRDLSKFRSLCLGVPSTDDNGKPNELIIRKVWWGSLKGTDMENRQRLLPEILSKTAVESRRLIDSWTSDRAYRRTVELSGLPMQQLDVEVMDLEGMLISLFEQFNPAATNIVMGRGTAYVKLLSEQSVDEAIAKINNFVIGTDDDRYTIKVSRLNIPESN